MKTTKRRECKKNNNKITSSNKGVEKAH